jgi:predicted DsbA family dithiol-disulfide isomerase
MTRRSETLSLNDTLRVLHLCLLLISSFLFNPVYGQTLGKPIVAIVNGAGIDQDDLENRFDLQQQVYEVKVNVLQELISKKLLALAASKAGLTTDQLLDKEVESKIDPPSEGEIHGFYLAQPERYTAPFASVHDEVARDLRETEVHRARKAFLDELRSAAKIAILLDVPRIPVEVGDAPRRGAEAARVTVIEFGDYQCPFCRGVQATLHELREKYGDKVSFVFKNYPLREIHPLAQDAAEAASCAREQDQFWEFHDSLFAAPSLTPAALEGLAGQLRLDVNRFDQCLASHKYAARIDADIEQGKQMGMSGTPAFNINGAVLTGAQSPAEFERLIDRELAREGKVTPHIAGQN